MGRVGLGQRIWTHVQLCVEEEEEEEEKEEEEEEEQQQQQQQQQKRNKNKKKRTKEEEQEQEQQEEEQKQQRRWRNWLVRHVTSLLRHVTVGPDVQRRLIRPDVTNHAAVVTRQLGAPQFSFASTSTDGPLNSRDEFVNRAGFYGRCLLFRFS